MKQNITNEEVKMFEEAVELHYNALESILIKCFEDTAVADKLLLSGLCDSFNTFLLENSNITNEDIENNELAHKIASELYSSNDVLKNTLITMKLLSGLLFLSSISANAKKQ